MRKKVWIAISLQFVVVSFLGGCNQEPVPPPEEEILPEELAADPIAEEPEEYWFPDNLRWLTDSEKTRIIEIALATPESLEWRQKESQYKTKIGWIALRPDPSGKGYAGYCKHEYEVVAKGIPVYPEDLIILKGDQKVAEVYPCATIWFGEPNRWVVSVAVDLNEEKAVDVEDYPARNVPVIPDKTN